MGHGHSQMKSHQWINSRGKRLSAMIQRPDGLENTPVVIFCHGFTGDKVGGFNQLLLQLAKAMEAVGITTVRFDFAGSGDSEGEFAEDTMVSGWKEDLRNVISWAKNQPEYITSPVYLLGHSLGGCIVLLNGEDELPVAGRIVLAPVIYPVDNFRDIILGPVLWEESLSGKTISNFYGKGFSLEKQFVHDLVEYSYFPLQAVRSYSTPLLIIHGTNDAAVPLKGSEDLHQVYGGEKELVLIEDADHVFTGHINTLQLTIVDWLREHTSRMELQ